MTREEEFWALVNKQAANGCWNWTGKTTDGYGYFYLAGRSQRAHRAALMFKGETIPPGMHVDHLCRNRACVNPLHLRVVTPKENTLAPGSEAVTAVNAAKTHCPKGHPLVVENLVATILKRFGWRACAICWNERSNRYRRERRRRRRLALQASPPNGGRDAG